MPLISYKTKILAIGLMALLLAPNSMSANVGKVTKQIGEDASIARDSDTIVVGEGTGVQMKDSITTSKAKLELTFDDNTKVSITRQSKLVIDDFVYDANSGTGKLAMNVAMGTVRYASGAIARNSRENVRLRTPTATIAVRGTDFTMTVDEIGRSLVILLPTCPKPDDPATCFTGVIEVSTDVGMVVLNQAFQATVVASATSAPTKPKIIDILEQNIDNMLIISPPAELPGGMAYIDQAEESSFLEDDAFIFEELIAEYLTADELAYSELDIDYLGGEFLDNILDLTNMLSNDELSSDPVLPNIHNFKGYIQYSYNEEVIYLRAERPPHVAQVNVDRWTYGFVNIAQDGIIAPLQMNDGGVDVIINITQSE
tara:strand:- start:346 stop:1458 length:1113 start_codon:yes stop_codon:yes gene_type:complete